jgi:photosystem II stability/assembly factor-like uncharacterized protein
VFYNRDVRIAVILLNFCLCVPATAQWWSVQTSGLDTNLRGVSVSRTDKSKGNGHQVVWASGSKGVILRSTDGGTTWQQLHVAGGDDLDFRDIEGFDANTAFVMSSGDGDKSRIYKTTDGGTTWKLQYSDKRAGFFLDSLACASKTHCVGLSDPVEGKFLVLSTGDGEHWKELPRDKMPSALAGEGGFAASGTSIALCGQGTIYFGTGGGETARVFRSRDRGRSWVAVDTPIAAGKASSGIFSITCGKNVVAVAGGDYKEPDNTNHVAADSYDSGTTWHLASKQPGGYRSAVAYLSHGDFVAVGPSGEDIAFHEGNEGLHWDHTDSLNLNAVAFEGQEGWGVGPHGAIARFRIHSHFRTKY